MDGKFDGKKQDDEANYFAMCLLMPKELVLQEVATLKGVDIEKGIKILAKRFIVSELMMTKRLIQLKIIAL